jgi:protein required for attachment to host cells
MTTRLVLADLAEARFYELEEIGGAMRLVGELRNPSARLHERDLVSDRPGRVFDRAAKDVSRRGAVAHHATGGEETSKHHAAVTFASHVVQALQSAQNNHEFDRLVLAAGPQFMGMLRAAMPKHLADLVVAEVTKDLVHEPENRVLAHLPANVVSAKATLRP